ncbi:hypothetical protein TrVE_jg12712 [Triparma verrucosa]|uniref:Thiaminase-2/PQQC domain-containing protein n=2 Tax=Triparma TaxID=722752 RepID=A0A9W7C4V5_9STRA|nr:hypothetical protein TrST_g979 [Triparma strigata]GMI10542.1 hypothetical protein TrVE_jg12712 [Triparma verrucosa]
MSVFANCDHFWQAASKPLAATEKHPFLLQMLDSSLPIPSFKHYVVQDAMYLTEFARCLRILSVKSPESLKKRFEDFAVGAEEAEMSLHKGYFDVWKIKPIIGVQNNEAEADAEKVDFAPTTLMYTSWMLGICSAEDFAYGVASLLACFWVYQYMGEVMLKERQRQRDAGTYKVNEVYDKWIDMYGSEEFEKEVVDYKTIAETCAEGLDEQGKKKMEDIFVRGCVLEYMFWTSSLELSKFPEFE